MTIDTDWDAGWRADVAARAAHHPNPPCVTWCRELHAPTEFAANGGLSCSREIGSGPGWGVTVGASRWAPDEYHLWGPLGDVQLDVRIHDSSGSGHVEALAIEQLHPFAEALEAAHRFCALRGGTQ